MTTLISPAYRRSSLVGIDFEDGSISSGSNEDISNNKYLLKGLRPDDSLYSDVTSLKERAQILAISKYMGLLRSNTLAYLKNCRLEEVRRIPKFL